MFSQLILSAIALFTLRVSAMPAYSEAPAETASPNSNAADALAAGILINIDWQVHELA
jgi:hypothetical protein